MLKVKDNYKNNHRDMLCRACERENETQGHILQFCSSLHTDDSNRVAEETIFNEDFHELRDTAKKINTIMGRLLQE